MSDQVCHRDGLAEAKRLRIPGCCVFCEAPVGPRRVTCSGKECKAAYFRAWHRDQALRTPERYGPAFYRARRERIAAISDELEAKP